MKKVPVPNRWRWLMGTDIVVYSQCEKCDEQGMFLDPENCARCLSGREPVKIDEEENEAPQPFFLLAA